MLTKLKQKAASIFFRQFPFIPTTYYFGIGSILMLHSVEENFQAYQFSSNQSLVVSPAFLEEVIRFCKANDFEFIPLDEIPIWLQKRSKKKFICLTLDDGYKNNYSLAYPILKKHNIPFTIYVSTSYPDQTAIFWWFALEDLLTSQPEIQFSFKGNNYHYNLSQLNNNIFNQIALLFIESNIQERDYLIQELFVKYNIDYNKYTKSLGLTWHEIKELAKDSLVTIGAHTHNHLALSCQSEFTAEQEIKLSKEKLEDNLGQPVFHFAYPYGGRNACSYREFELLQKLNFKTATTTRFGNIFKEHANFLHALPRIPLGNFMGMDFCTNFLHDLNVVHTNYSKVVVF